MSILPKASEDRRLIKAANQYMTPEQMSEAVLGQLTPAQCIERLQYLTTHRVTLDEVQERRLLVFAIAEHLEWMKAKREDPKTWAHINRAYKLLSDQVERTNVNIADVSTKLAEAHAQTYVEAYMLGFNALLKTLVERDMLVIEPEDAQELVTLSIAESSRYLDAHTQKAAE